MQRGLLEGIKASPFIPRWLGGGDSANDGSVLTSDSTQEGGARLASRRIAVGSPPTIVAANGTSSLVVAGHDEAHNVSVAVPGGQTADAAIATLTFAATYGLYLPTFVITPKNAAAAAAVPFVFGDSITGYQIGLHNPPAAVATGTVAYRASSFASGGGYYGTGAAQGATCTITIPSAVTVGDLMLIGITVRPYTSPPVTPTGWTLAYQSSSAPNSSEMFIYTKVAVSGDTGGATTVTLSTYYSCAGVFVAYSGSAATLNATNSSAGNTGSTLTAPSVTPNVSGTVILEFWGSWDNLGAGQTITPPATSRGTATGSGANWSSAAGVSEQAGPASGVASGSTTATMSVANVDWNGATVAVSPYVAPPTTMLFDVLVTGR